LSGRRTACAGFELQGLNQSGGNYLRGGDHSIALKPDFGIRAANIMSGELGSIAEPERITLGQR
jgi:hypothetical protein